MNQAQFKTRAIDFASGLVEPTIADVAREFEIGTERSVSGSPIGIMLCHLARLVGAGFLRLFRAVGRAVQHAMA